MKRLLDIVGATLGLVVLSPLLLGVALAIRLTSGPGVLFRQERPGLGGRTFTMYKFKTMLDARDASGVPLPDERRITRVGAVLRRWSLDELPELWNVLTGEMSLVGPRPLLAEYLPLYSAEQARRHEVRPGMTGWAQVNGRNAITWEQKFAYDVWYVDNRSLLLDLRILGMTVAAVLRREGITQEGHATAERFRGAAPAGSDTPEADGERQRARVADEGGDGERSDPCVS
ncbi:MAG TPA: sugar transferase [Coriobacteriia bacterium]|nr:sugar transferase [Coriobacteriia bacterium]